MLEVSSLDILSVISFNSFAISASVSSAFTDPMDKTKNASKVIKNLLN
jgi:hypothetical protein